MRLKGNLKFMIFTNRIGLCILLSQFEEQDLWVFFFLKKKGVGKLFSLPSTCLACQWYEMRSTNWLYLSTGFINVLSIGSIEVHRARFTYRWPKCETMYLQHGVSEFQIPFDFFKEKQVNFMDWRYRAFCWWWWKIKEGIKKYCWLVVQRKT